mmetsp:Transcript_6028/g.23855  ORF Transcript_6028/g.23855 Transcript_6028/m.23855 type:complete len:223 (-) Transcript_6028:897-1565(-)
MNMSIWRASCTESRVSYPSPCAMALATTPKRCRNLYTKQNESSPCCTSEPTRKSPGVMVLWSVSVSTGACALHAWSLPYSKSALATPKETLPSKPVHRIGGCGVRRTISVPSSPGSSSPFSSSVTLRLLTKLPSSSSASPHVACTRKPLAPPLASSTLVTRSGASRRGGVGISSASLMRCTVYGASSVEGSSVVVVQQRVDAATVHFLPHAARLNAASMPLS